MINLLKRDNGKYSLTTRTTDHLNSEVIIILNAFLKNGVNRFCWKIPLSVAAIKVY